MAALASCLGPRTDPRTSVSLCQFVLKFVPHLRLRDGFSLLEPIHASVANSGRLLPGYDVVVLFAALNFHALDLLNGTEPAVAPWAFLALVILLDVLRRKLLLLPSELVVPVSCVSATFYLLGLLAQLEAMNYPAPMVSYKIIFSHSSSFPEVVLGIEWAQMRLLCWDTRHPSQAYHSLKTCHLQVASSYRAQFFLGLADVVQDFPALDASSTLLYLLYQVIAVSLRQNRNLVALAHWTTCAYFGLGEF